MTEKQEQLAALKSLADKIGLAVLLLGIPVGSIVALYCLGRWLFE